MTLAWLCVILAGLALWTLVDSRQFRQFRDVQETRIRQRFFWQWTAQSFLFLGGASVITLALLDRLDAVWTIPAEFRGVMPVDRPVPSSPDAASGQRAGLIAGFAIGAFISLMVWRHRLRRMHAPLPEALLPLIPRTAGERWAALTLSLNAGFSEELFFRLALPLLLLQVTGSITLSLGVSLLAFGFAHWYQGWRGIVGTTLVGMVMTAAYFASGSLLRVMIVHALIDVIGLLVRPVLAARRQAR
jgi:uncharacterized protein